LVAQHDTKGAGDMTGAFKAPPHASTLDRTGLEDDLEVMKPFFLDHGFTNRYGVDIAHTHYPFNLADEAVLRVDLPEALTRVTSVVPKAQVNPKRAVGWWFGSDGSAVASLFAAEQMYAHDWEEELAEIGRFLAANGLTKYGVRSLQRSFPVGDDQMEVEHTQPRERIQVFNVIPRTATNDPGWTGKQSVWWFTNKDGGVPQGVTECLCTCWTYCNPGGAEYQ
jgi:hypothetical protein